jgi:3-hydroxybutyryl-CoA dehydrogenase
MEIRKAGVCGCGLMGSGIAEVAAKAGFQVIVCEVDSVLLNDGLNRVAKSLSRAVEKGKLDESGKKSALANITGTVELNRIAECDLIIEAINENLDDKISLLRRLDKISRKETIFASNTSSLSITQMGAATDRPDRFCGMHFFNPVPVMKLVEVVKTIDTSAKVFENVKKFCERLGKVVVACKDSPGFVVNRLLVPYLLDSIRVLEAGVAIKEDIDAGMKLGCGYPMGPLELVDFVGLDTTYHVAEILFDEYKDHRYASPPLLKAMVKAGYHGRKAGRGFYEYG